MVVWEDEFLGKVKDGHTNAFDISIRFKELEYMLKWVVNNFFVFVERINKGKVIVLDGYY